MNHTGGVAFAKIYDQTQVVSQVSNKELSDTHYMAGHKDVKLETQYYCRPGPEAICAENHMTWLPNGIPFVHRPDPSVAAVSVVPNTGGAGTNTHVPTGIMTLLMRTDTCYKYTATRTFPNRFMRCIVNCTTAKRLDVQH